MLLFRSLLVAVLFISSMFFTGCATVTRGTKDVLVIESDPSGAQVRLSTGQTGRTPTSFRLPRKHPVTVHVSAEGYEPLTIEVNPQVVGAGSAGMAGNVIVGGLVGAVVDLSTGAMKNLKPNPVVARLTPIPAPRPASESTAQKTEPATPGTPLVAPVATASPVDP